MCWNSFSRSLGFAALAALGFPAAFAFGAPLVGVATTLKIAAVTAAAVYAIGLAPDWPRRVRVAVVAAGLGGALLVLPLGVDLTVAGAATLLAVCRSGLTFRSRPLRAVAIETLLGFGALATAGFLATGGSLSFALAVWGFFLVQSGFFLVGGVAIREDEASIDPFDRARRQLLALLGDGPDLSR